MLRNAINNLQELQQAVVNVIANVGSEIFLKIQNKGCNVVCIKLDIISNIFSNHKFLLC
jgi:hypothetical protein